MTKFFTWHPMWMKKCFAGKCRQVSILFYSFAWWLIELSQLLQVYQRGRIWATCGILGARRWRACLCTNLKRCATMFAKRYHNVDWYSHIPRLMRWVTIHILLYLFCNWEVGRWRHREELFWYPTSPPCLGKWPSDRIRGQWQRHGLSPRPAFQAKNVINTFRRFGRRCCR